MLYLVDSGMVINNERFAFQEKHRYALTQEILDEFKDFRSKNLVENALQNKLVKLVFPEEEFKAKVKANIKKINMRLSEADISLLAAAEQLRQKGKVTVLTDDYSVQNYCKIHKISFQGGIMGEIKEAVSFAKNRPKNRREKANNS